MHLFLNLTWCVAYKYETAEVWHVVIKIITILKIDLGSFNNEKYKKTVWCWTETQVENGKPLNMKSNV